MCIMYVGPRGGRGASPSWWVPEPPPGFTAALSVFRRLCTVWSPSSPGLTARTRLSTACSRPAPGWRRAEVSGLSSFLQAAAGESDLLTRTRQSTLHPAPSLCEPHPAPPLSPSPRPDLVSHSASSGGAGTRVASSLPAREVTVYTKNYFLQKRKKSSR